MFRKLVVVAIFSLTTLTANAWSLFGPKDYDGCILESMKGVTSDLAARNIQRSCMEKFPKKTSECKATNFTRDEYDKLSIQAFSSQHSGYLTLKIHNNNRNKSITAINVELSAENINPPQEYEMYIRYDKIGPLKSGEATATLQKKPTGKWTYKITAMKGCVE